MVYDAKYENLPTLDSLVEDLKYVLSRQPIVHLNPLERLVQKRNCFVVTRLMSGRYSLKPNIGCSCALFRGIKGLVETSPGISMNDIREYFFDGTLDHYFRYAYRIVKYVKTSKLIDDDEREGYASIFRAQLSCFELLVLFFNCLGMDENKFKHLVEDYHLFNNIRTEYFPDIEPYSTLYLDKVNSEDGKERNGFDEEAEKTEYSISAFKKPQERNITQRILCFKQIWELRPSFSTRRSVND